MHPYINGCRREECPFLKHSSCKVVDRIPGSLQACPIDEIRVSIAKYPSLIESCSGIGWNIMCGDRMYPVMIEIQDVYTHIKERYG